MTNDEIRMKKRIQKAHGVAVGYLNSRNSAFARVIEDPRQRRGLFLVFVSSFVIRISSLIRHSNFVIRISPRGVV
jgi:hypothetical protein